MGVPFENLKKISDMSLEEVEGEIQIRGENHLVSSWETRCQEQGPPIIRDAVAGSREMTKDYFCRNTLRDLRKKTVGFPIPPPKRNNPESSISPVPIKPTQKPDIFYLHPKNKTKATASSLATT